MAGMHLLALLACLTTPSSILIQGGTVYDGTGSPGVREDVRLRGDMIVAVGRLRALKGEQVVDARGMAVAPGFIDAHSHADGGIKDHPDAESQVRQGITTSVVGQDGGWQMPVKPYLLGIQGYHPAINFAAFSGEGGIRSEVMGKDFERAAWPDEIAKMKSLVERDMEDGALGLSTGLEYNPGYYSSTAELIELSKVAARHGGLYISHVRDETNGEIGAFQELVRIGREAKLPVQISHIKLAVASMWPRYNEVAQIISRERNSYWITVDVYPYLYWQSTISVLTNSRDWGNPKVWDDGLKDIGGAQNVRLVRYTPDPTWVGKTLAELAAQTGKDPAHLIMEVIDKTKDGKGQESIVCTAMREEDLQRFIATPNVMFCSDGSIGGTHPRGAGSFPRVLGRYVRDLHVITLREALRKMTSFPAETYKLDRRGLVKRGYFADVVVFDPVRIRDVATPQNPMAFSEGVVDMFVSGVPLLRDGRMTGARGGKALFRRLDK